MSRVTVIGAGAMGAGIAQVAAQHGWDVHLQDVNDAVVDSEDRTIGVDDLSDTGVIKLSAGRKRHVLLRTT